MGNFDDSNKIENIIFYLEHHLNTEVLSLISLVPDKEFTLNDPEINNRVFSILSKHDWNKIKYNLVSYGANSLFTYPVTSKYTA